MAVAPRLYYDVSPEGLRILQPSHHAQGYQPVLVLLVGPGNVLEAPPRRAVSLGPGLLSVACADGWVVLLDITEGVARRTRLQTEEVYDGSLQEGNQGRGWIPVR
ncbi:MAG: hypothetical protein NZ951_07545 [Dehalococcoidia bacterium]|nr:hypothetical protein [Dehalococcoidia bacterium]MDW8119269.1 hypothetical protein [Chloroflexota bacterium]